MIGDAQTGKIDIVELAKKQRHIHLLGKMQMGKTLRSGEVKELDKLETGPGLSDRIVDSTEKVALYLKVSDRQVRRWLKDGAPKVGENRYDVIEIQKWRDARKALSKAKVSQSGDKWNERLKRARALGAELKIQKEQDEYVSKVEVIRMLSQMVGSFKRAFLSLPRILAPQLEGLPPREIEGLLERKIREIIGSFAQGKQLFK